MARISVKSICDQYMAEYKTIAFIIASIAKKLSKEVGESVIRAQANRLVREKVIDPVRAAKRYGIRGPKTEDVQETTKRKITRKGKVDSTKKKSVVRKSKVGQKKSSKKGVSVEKKKVSRRSKK